MANVYFEVYGCSSNVAEAEIMQGILCRAGYRIVASSRDSDVNVIVTCIVKTPTEHRMIYRISKLTEEGKPLIVAGCMPMVERFIVERLNPKASLIGPSSISRIVDAVKIALDGGRAVFLEREGYNICMPRVRRNPIIGIVEIAQGCLSACSFCQVRFARGRLVSYPPDMIVEEVRRALADGCREIWITSQDNACYGYDIGLKFTDLLKRILSIEGDFYVRIGMMNPVYVKPIVDDLIECLDSDRFFKFIHLPVQSGSDRILKLMRRMYTVGDYLEIVDKLRSGIDKLSIATDIIVGFPSETDEDFQSTIDLIREVEHDSVNISKFGARPLTEAAKMKPLPSSIVDERSRIASEIAREVALSRNKRIWVGWCGEALVDEEGLKPGSVIARNAWYKPIALKDDTIRLGERVYVRVVEAYPYHLLGEVLA
ncbi:MAG: tRNA (N(6)-L-threonylcarbamoyladenosine(37)-C(2))-methylthiotransferase [Nitrososphaerota archaeon]|nr:tRNA (N(6)-L-threonylcarbamoyladenosine(37)-C(2))-methylthiotransferase [Candidatus Bathyarchaeota archaeon]MCX8161525.1 tRNA (N(6)-L-threonylcarbamoyladenosine(37)-C(2))-methylthiotransferase [Candidatus Bathyarchaeota archaeon]MDW8061581.1 tRNA (N(6)-L-threonylcarbamoyladenosine(37)-C(2))-methylthiotransferase [Nitrososphaerota archaeon]